MCAEAFPVPVTYLRAIGSFVPGNRPFIVFLRLLTTVNNAVAYTNAVVRSVPEKTKLESVVKGHKLIGA